MLQFNISIKSFKKLNAQKCTLSELQQNFTLIEHINKTYKTQVKLERYKCLIF